MRAYCRLQVCWVKQAFLPVIQESVAQIKWDNCCELHQAWSPPQR